MSMKGILVAAALCAIAIPLRAQQAPPPAQRVLPPVELPEAFSKGKACTTTRKPERCGVLAQHVLQYNERIKRLVALASSKPALTAADWAPLEELIAVDEFVRIGAQREMMSWREYVDFLTRWGAGAGGYENTVRRITAAPGIVFLELEERNGPTRVGSVNSVSIYEFNKAGKLNRLHIYLAR